MKTTPTKTCLLCENAITNLDYKDADMLRRFISPQGRVNGPKRTGSCAKHQRIVEQTVKRARILGLVPFITR